ncbi:MAG: DNA-3-methyladenine glycosylase 2 family protein [Flavobacteriales bacterium]|nr:DNA-3-methyladenine glycosylase 2 family protein [Flavobacteriales bacterium]
MSKSKKLKWNFEEVQLHFGKCDPRVAGLMKSIGPIEFRVHTDHFHALVESIISQQLSVKASDTIFRRLLTHCGDALSPQVLAKMKPDAYRVHGISGQKAGYLIDLAGHFCADSDRFSHLAALSDQEVIDALVDIKGIGEWTAQMFLMFTLGRMDVFAPGDLGLRNAMMALYRWKEVPGREKMINKAKKWAPYRTIACRYLWRSLNNS